MKVLELKIPPALLMLLWGFGMWVITRLLPLPSLEFSTQNIFARGLSLIGIIFITAGIYRFHRARTTVDPAAPHQASSMVTGGVYRLTRNPMYLGFLLLLSAWAVKLGHPFAFLLLPGFIIYLNRFQIRPEERALQEKFGGEFNRYRQTVRRWL